MMIKLSICALFLTYFGALKCTNEFEIGLPVRVEWICDEGFQLFKENCYKSMPNKANFSESQEDCISIEANLSSIHEAEANLFLLDMVKPQNLLLGLEFDGVNYTWTDQSPYNYTNWADDYNPTEQAVIFGECVMMLGDDQWAKSGQWINKYCHDSDTLHICQKPAKVKPTEDPPTEVPPNECSSKPLITGGGMLYSPGYPYYYDGTVQDAALDCSYLLGANPAPISITFEELSGDSEISIYEGQNKGGPQIGKFTGGFYYLPRTFTSNKTTMLVHFASSDKGKWRAKWGPSSPSPTQEQSSMSFGSVPQGLK